MAVAEVRAGTHYKDAMEESPMLRFIALAIVAVAGAVQAAPPASGGSSGVTKTIERQLHDTRAQVETQHAHASQLKSRVSELEQRSAAQKAQQAQRDREIAELQRKLAALNAHSAPVPAHSAGHR